MSLDLHSEELLRLSVATRFYPKNANGKRPDVAQLYRHARIGIRGIRLEVVQTPAGLCTSRQKIALFFERLTQQQSSAREAPVAQPTASRDSIRAEQAGQVLNSTIFHSPGRRHRHKSSPPTDSAEGADLHLTSRARPP